MLRPYLWYSNYPGFLKPHPDCFFQFHPNTECVTDSQSCHREEKLTQILWLVHSSIKTEKISEFPPLFLDISCEVVLSAP